MNLCYFYQPHWKFDSKQKRSILFDMNPKLESILGQDQMIEPLYYYIKDKYEYLLKKYGPDLHGIYDHEASPNELIVFVYSKDVNSTLRKNDWKVQRCSKECPYIHHKYVDWCPNHYHPDGRRNLFYLLLSYYRSYYRSDLSWIPRELWEIINNYLNPPKKNNSISQVYVYAQNWNILLMMSGLGGLSYSS